MLNYINSQSIHLIVGFFICLIALSESLISKDCTASCLFPQTYKIWQNNTLAAVFLTQTFDITFQVQGQVPQDNSFMLTLLPLGSSIPLLDIGLSGGTNKLAVYYQGALVISNGPSVSNTNLFTTVTVNVGYDRLTISNGVTSQYGPITARTSPYSYLMTSNPTENAVAGNIRNIKISGPLCCGQTAYYQTNWQTCNNAADYTSTPVTSCSTCLSYSCLDWIVGSQAMTQREASYFRDTNDSVYFAVGALGGDASLAGLCYRITLEQTDRDIIAQVISTGGNASNFEVLIAAGGLGSTGDACLKGDDQPGSLVPQFYGAPANWGNYQGGIDNSGSCVSVTSKPICGAASAPDDMVHLCQLSFERFLRLNPGNTDSSSPRIQKMGPVMCPPQLYKATGLHRLDEPNMNYSLNSTLTKYGGHLDRYMDCRRPDYADPLTLKKVVVDPSYSAITPCRRDGYARIDSLPPLPSATPTMEPSMTPTAEPSAGPTVDPLCCVTTSYADHSWQTCSNGAASDLGDVTSCASCVTYSCFDWLPGSEDMIQREQLYYQHTLDKVYFGVGSYGNDPSKGGLCYRIKTDTIDRDLIVQVVSKHVEDGNFKLMLADGGLGAENACTFDGSSVPQFASLEGDWGNLYGGWSFPEQCALLPDQPACGFAKDSMQNLCEFSFTAGFRKTDLLDSNPSITHVCEVSCPSELWMATGLHRLDEVNSDFQCATGVPPVATTGQLLRYMDCAKPEYAWGGINGLLDPDYDIVVPCRRDGYARVNSIPTMPPTSWPSYAPTATNPPTPGPSKKPSVRTTTTPTFTVTSPTPTVLPTFAPSVDPLCCSNTVYEAWQWPYCKNAANVSSQSVTSCSACTAYQCVDWNVLSSAMQEREANFLIETGEKVYFGVGSYGNDLSRAGLCYRLTVNGIDRDLIVQVITEGNKVADGNFNVMMADGGFSDEYNACVNTKKNAILPQFPGNLSQWGGNRGGWVNQSGCDLIPEYPICAANRVDNMRTLCRESFQRGFRIPNNVAASNPTISKMCAVKCPSQLWTATGLHRKDEANKQVQCVAGLSEPAGGKLSRSMDCSKPSYGSVSIANTFADTQRVVPCRRDGYTRINSRPTSIPTLMPTASPTKNDTLCCADTVYREYEWPYCQNPADSTILSVPSCAASSCLSYQCIDWNVLSTAMQQREKDYKSKNKGDNVYFGVGSYGRDPSRAGLCYRIRTKEIDRDLIVQVITQGADDRGGYFNLMMADGGFSDDYTACAREGSIVPQFGATSDRWGGLHGGWANVSGCDLIPPYPVCASRRIDNMQQLCRNTFIKNFRLPNVTDSNPHISVMCQVKCPPQLWQATGLRRRDEVSTSYQCDANRLEPPNGLLSRSMDCSKPTYAWGPIEGTYNGSSVVVPCRRDGYTRINSVPSSMPTRAPTRSPSKSVVPSIQVTAAPTFDPLCCPYYPYTDPKVWQTCSSASNPSLGKISTCKQCLAYQCIDWTVGSVAMQAREAQFLNRTGQKVHFGVGSYSNEAERAGKCYRISVQGVLLDLIVQNINQGATAADGNFELMMGAGGFAGNQACIAGSGADVPLYPGNASMWGPNYGFSGGPTSYFKCDSLPRYPICGVNPQDDLRDLCKWSFSKGMRYVSGKPYITSMCEVACPTELWMATGLHRIDEPRNSYMCGTAISGGGNLNKMMDCGKPAYAWSNNLNGKLVDSLHNVVIPCKRDGYTRINEEPVYPPSTEPTYAPTFTARPTVVPTSKPTLKPSNMTVIKNSKKDDGFFFSDIATSSRTLSVVTVGGFVLLVMLIILVCEYWLRVTRRRELMQRVEEKRRVAAMRNLTRNGSESELLQELTPGPTTSLDAIELRRSYSAYQKVNRALLHPDQVDVAM